MSEELVEEQEGTEGWRRGDQNVEIEDCGPARKKMTVTVPAARIKEAFDETYSQLKNDAAIPGFRKGRAPMRLIERRFGAGVKSDLKAQLISETYSQAIEDKNIEVLGEPEIDGIEEMEVSIDEALTYTVEMEVFPEFDLPAYDDIQVEKKTYEVKDEDIDEEVKNLQNRFGQMQEVTEEDATIDIDDYLLTDVRIAKGHDADLSKEDAEVLHSANDHYVHLNGESLEFKGHIAGIVIEDLSNKLKGKKSGDTVCLNVTGPSSHENEEIRDEDITVETQIKSVIRQVPAEVDKVIEMTGSENEEGLKEQIKGMLENRNERKAKSEMHQQVIEQLQEKVDMDLPAGLSGRQAERNLMRKAQEMAYVGKSQEEIDQELAEMRNDNEEQSHKDLKAFFILQRIANELEIEVDQQQLNAHISNLAMERGRRPEKLRQEMLKSGQLEQLYTQIREHNTLDEIIEKATVTDAS